MKQFKKVLASVLALAMVVTAVPTADAQAAKKAPKLNNYKKILYVGQSYTLKVNNLPANWKKCTYAWSASNKNVTVKKGKYGQAAKVTAVKKGTATVTVKMTYPQTAAQKKAKKKTVKTFKCAVTVKNPSVKFTTTADRIEVGETAQFTAKATPSTAKVTYSSSDAAVATVDATGLVTAVADGTATIKASAKVGTKTVSASKTVEVYTAPTEAKQTKVKEITITSGKVVTKESKIEVKKGSVEVALAEKKDGSKDIAIDATGKTVVLTTAAKLTKGEYTVTIDGVTANFTAEDEKVTAIEFTSDKAVLDAQVCTTAGCKLANPAGTTPHVAGDKMIYKTATAAYKVYNQFKEDITGETSVSVSGNGATLKEKGTVQFESQATDGFRLNDIVAAVVIYNNNGVAVTKSGTFTVSNEAAISEIAIKDGVYDKKGAAVTLTEDTDLSKGVYVLVSAKDQYGRAVTALTHDSNVLLQSAGGLTNLKLDNTRPSIEITVDGVKYAGFRLIKEDNDKAIGAGTATVLVISKGTGVTAQGTVTVANGGKVDTITIQVPGLVVGNEDTELGYTALDSYQKEVTSVSALTAVQGIYTQDQVVAGQIYAKEDAATGKAKLYYKAASNPNVDPKVDAYDVESLLTPTYKATTVNITVQPDAKAKAIVGTDKLTTGALSGQDFVVTKENIKVADQYGRTDKLSIDNYKIFAYFPDGADSNKAFDIDATGKELFNRTVSAETKDGSTIAKAAEVEKKLTAGATDARHKVEATVEAGEKESTTKVRFVLASTKDDLTDQSKTLSTYDVTFTSTVDANVKTYEVADIGTVYAGTGAGTAYNKDLDVKGVSPDGTKVAIPQNKYVVEVKGVTDTADEFKVAQKGSTTLKEIVTADLTGARETLDATKDKATAEITLTFTFEDGQSIEKKVTISRETPQVKEVKIKDGKDALELTTAKSTAKAKLDKAKAAETAIKAAETAVNTLNTTKTKANFTAAESAVATAKTAANAADTALSSSLETAVDAIQTELDNVDDTNDSTVEGSAARITAALSAANAAATNATAQVTTAQATYDSADGTIAGMGYNNIKALIEAKDQYGVDIAASAAPRVTVSEAKKANGDDVRTSGNGATDTVFAADTVKAKVTLTFDGGYVFTAKVVSK